MKLPNFKKLTAAGGEIITDHFDPVERAEVGNASELSMCIRRQWYTRKGAEQEEQDWGYARRGQALEAFIIDAWKAANLPVTFAGKDQLSLRFADDRLSATPDCILQYDTDWVVPEIKTYDPRSDTSKFPKAAHVRQNQLQMEAVDANLDYPGHLLGCVVYVNASNIYDVMVFPVDWDPGIVDWALEREKKARTARSVGNLDREGVRAGECSECPFKAICEPPIVKKAGADVVKANRGSKLHEAVELMMHIKTLKKQEADAKETIMGELEKRGSNKVSIAGHLVRLEEVAGRKSLDKKAVEQAGIDLEPFYKTGRASTRLTIK